MKGNPPKAQAALGAGWVLVESQQCPILLGP